MQFCKWRINHDSRLGAGRGGRRAGRCFVEDSKERGQLWQAVKGLSVAGRTVNKGAEDHGREQWRREGERCTLCPE